MSYLLVLVAAETIFLTRSYSFATIELWSELNSKPRWKLQDSNDLRRVLTRMWSISFFVVSSFEYHDSLWIIFFLNQDPPILRRWFRQNARRRSELSFRTPLPCVRLSVRPFCLLIHLSIRLFIYLSIYLSIHSFICHSLWHYGFLNLSIYSFIYLSLSMTLWISQSIYLFIHLSFTLYDTMGFSIYLSIHSFIFHSLWHYGFLTVCK